MVNADAHKVGDHVPVYGGDGHCHGEATLMDYALGSLWYVQFESGGPHFLRSVVKDTGEFWDGGTHEI